MKVTDQPFDSENGEDVPTVVVSIKKVEARITFVPKSRVHVAPHFMEKIEIVHQLVEHIASAALDEDGSVGVSVGVDGAGGALAADVAGEGDTHPPAGRFSEERPRECRDGAIARNRVRRSGSFHSRTSRPTFPHGCAQNQTHGFILGKMIEKRVVLGEGDDRCILRIGVEIMAGFSISG